MNETDVGIFQNELSLCVRDIKLSCNVPNTNNDMLACIIGNGDIILYSLPHDQYTPVMRWIPWFDDVRKKIQALTFSPGIGKWLLIACNDRSLYIIPALSLLNTKDSSGTEEYNWSKDDITCITPPITITSEFVPSSIAWWVRPNFKGELRDVGILGSTIGQIVIFAIYSGNIIVTTKVEGLVRQIEICDQEPNACVIITNNHGRQWRLLFHQPTRETSEKTKHQNANDTKSSKLLGLKQLSVDTLANIKQRISETRSKSIATILPVECAEGDVVCCAPQWQLNVKLQSVSETTLSVHNKIITASYPANIVAVENFITNSNTVHKLPYPGIHLVLSSALFFFTNVELNRMYVVSQAMSICRTDSNKHILNTDFNSDSLLQEYILLENERVIKMYCSNYFKHRCIMITNLGIYTFFLKEEPHKVVLESILSPEPVFHWAEKLSCVFGLDMQHLICEAADIQLTKGYINKATQLCGMSRSGNVRNVIMLAKFGHIPEVMMALKRSNLGNNHKLHLANLKVLAFVHEYLTRYSVSLHTEFIEMLNKGGYDESLAVSVLAQAGLCDDLLMITKLRGLQPITVIAIANILQRSYSLNIARCSGFWDLMGEYSLCEALLAKPQIAKIHLGFIQTQLSSLNQYILRDLEELYNPFRVSLKPWITYTCQGEVPIPLWVQTYLLTCIHLAFFKKESIHMGINNSAESCISSSNQKVVTVGQAIGAGFNHSCVILHGNVYSWGSTGNGCLGTGPSYPRVMGPALIETFPSIGIRVISVSCGRTHTVALTNNGIYTWGSNSYGQLGVGKVSQSWYPILVETFIGQIVRQISAGQYHSIAIDDKQRVFTWGWGVHGQLGHGNVEDYDKPKIVEALLDKGINWSRGGHAHSLFLDLEGKVWACGSSVFGQLGTGANNKSSIPLQVYGLPEKIVSLSTGYFHSVGLAHGGRVYQWGCSPTVLRAAAHAAKRRLRSHDNTEDGVQVDDNLSYLSPTLVDTSHVSGRIIKVSAGNEHNALITEDGTVYTWGRNMDGQLGNTATHVQRRSQHILHPTPITVGTTIKDVECGSDFTIAIDGTGKVWTWGANHHSAASRSALASFEGEVVVVKNRNRVIKLPHSGTNSQPLPTLLTIPTQHNDLPQDIKELPIPFPIYDWKTRMHCAIETLHVLYQPAVLIEKCIELGVTSLGAKLAQVNGDTVLAVKLYLQSTRNTGYISEILDHYLPLILHNILQLEAVLEFVVRFWNEYDLPIEELEHILNKYWDQLAKPLGQLLFRVNGGMSDMISQFTAEFNLRLVSFLLVNEEDNLDCILPGVHNVKDAINAINMSDEYIDIDDSMAYESVPLNLNNKHNFPTEAIFPSNQGLRKPSLYLK